MGMGWRSQHELIMCGTRENAIWSKHMDAQGNVITLKRDPNLEHPTMKPVALPDTVLETTPFAETVHRPLRRLRHDDHSRRAARDGPAGRWS